MEALSPGDKSTKASTEASNKPNVKTEIPTMSTIPTKIPLNSYNISPSIDDLSNVTLTPEDENNPELLAELDSILSTDANVVKKPESTETVSVSGSVDHLKKEILRLKKEGDIEGAKAKLLELERIKSRSGSGSKTVSIDRKTDPKIVASSVTANITAAVSPITVSPTTTHPSSPTNLTTSPKLASDGYRDLFSKLQKQSALCQTISDFYTSANRKPDATLFIKRKQAIDLELQKLRLMLKSKQPAPQAKVVDVTYEYVLGNPDVPDGQLQVTIGLLKIILPRKFKLQSDEEYKMKITYEISGLSEAETTLTSEPFTTSGLSNSKQLA